MNMPVTAGQSVLLVMDDEQDLAALKARLIEQGCRVATARSAAEALGLVGDLLPQLILLKVVLPGMDGFEVCRRLKEDGRTQDIPVLFLAAPTDPIDRIKGLRVGGLDYLGLPPGEAELEARVAAALRLKCLADKLQNPAAEDSLTGLLNRTCFEEHFHRECNRSRRYDSLFALVIFDIDGFKQVNERHGLGFGDHVLKTVADILRQQTRESDSLGRWGGNEFIVMLPEADLPKAIGFAKKLHAALTEHEFTAQGEAVRLRVSMGLASRQNIGGRDPADMLKLAHGSLHTAREAGGNRVAYHTVGQFDLVRM